MRGSSGPVIRSKAIGKSAAAIALLGLGLLILGLGAGLSLEPHQVAANSRHPRSAQQPVFPDFKLPYSRDVTVYWTGGPHGYNQGGDFTGVYTAGEGSGLDFSNGSHFEVLAMASGTVIEATCEGYGALGCIVAIQHDVGGTVVVYAHLDELSTRTVRERFSQAEQAGVSLWAAQGRVLGKAGSSGGQSSIHLHIDLRDGSTNCYVQCLPKGLGGNPIGWDDGLPIVDGYVIWGYRLDLDDPFRNYNYEGSAAKGDTALIYDFPFLDWPTNQRKTAAVVVHSSYLCDPSSDTCEDNSQQRTLTQFAGHGALLGAGQGISTLNVPTSTSQSAGQLLSSNSRVPIPPTPPPPTTDNATFVSDVTIPDGTVVSPGQSLHKVWRMANTGTSTWASGYEWVFISGEQMGAPSSVSVPNTSPGNTADIAVDMVAPNDPGAHCGTWRMRNPDRVFFGDHAWICIHVGTPDSHITRFTFDPPSPSSASMVRIYAKVENYPNLRAMRILVDGSVICELGAPEIYCDWNTGSYASGDHSVVVEVADWSDLNWVHPERRGAVYTLSGTPGNHRPNKPKNSWPYDWYVTIGTPPELCGEHQGDPDGDPIVSYQFQAEASVGTYDSPWVSGNCHTPSSLNPGTYSWKVRVKDSRGGVSDWSDPWHFSVEAAGVTINDVHFDPPSPSAAEEVKVFACTEGHAGVNIGLRVMVNDANDGSDRGEWHIIKELGVPCFNEEDAPVWRTLPYEDGTHRVRVVANAIQPDATDTRDELYTLLHRRPASPELLSPVDRHDVNRIVWLNTRDVTFSWDQTVRAQSFTLHVSTTAHPSADSSPVLRQSVGTNTSYSTTFTEDYPDLHWQVTATNDVGSNDSGAGHIGIDGVAPQTAVETLPETWYDIQFVVRWGGADDRSGISRYDIQFRDGARGEWVDWLVDTELTQSIFGGEAGHHYCFRSRARDNAGNEEAYAAGDGDSCTLIDLNSMPPTPWWDDNYSYKRTLVILNQDNRTLPSGYPVMVMFDDATSPTAAELYAASQSPTKGDDFRIVYQDQTELPRLIPHFSSTYIEIWLRTQASIGGLQSDNENYQLYYANAAASDPPDDPNQVWYPYKEGDTLALYFMQEDSGRTVYDYSGYARHCSMDPSVQWSSGKFGHGVYFPHANYGDSRSLTCGSFTPSSFTVETWLKRDMDGRLAGQLGPSGQLDWLLQLFEGRLRLDVWPCPPCGSSEVRSNFNLNNAPYAGRWNHVAVSFNGSNEVRFYINGSLDSVKYLSQSGINSYSVPLEIGSVEGISQIKAWTSGFKISSGVKTSFPYGTFANITSEPTSAAGSEISKEPPPPATDLSIRNVVTYPSDTEGQLIVQAVLDNAVDASTINGFWTDLYANHEPSGPGDYTGSISQWIASPIQAGSTITVTTVLTDTSSLGISSKFGASGIEEITKTLYLQTDTDGVVNDSDRTNNISPGVEVCFASADLYESDNDPTGAHLFQGTETHNIHVPGDEDWVKFNAIGGTTYAIETSSLGIAADTHIYLYDTDGITLLRANDDYGGTLASHIEWQAPADGTYYVAVKHWNPNVGGCGTRYDLSIGLLQPENLLSNSSFEEGGRIPAPWKANKNLTLNDRRVCNTAHDGSCSFRMVGGIRYRLLGTEYDKSLRQVVRMSGGTGDSFTLGGWSKARNPATGGGPYCLEARVFHTDGTKKSYRTCFSKETHGWQYREKTFASAKDYKKITVFLHYATQSGTAWFDDVRLVAH